MRLPAEQEKTGEVALVIFNSRRQNAPFVHGSRMAAGNSSCITQLIFYNVLHTSGRVIKRVRLYFRICAEEVAALIESYRMREGAANVGFLYSPGGDQVVNDPQ